MNNVVYILAVTVEPWEKCRFRVGGRLRDTWFGYRVLYHCRVSQV